jgi:tyrosinase
MPRARKSATTTRKTTAATRRRRAAKDARMEEQLAHERGHRLLLERNLPALAESMTFAKLVQPNLRFLNLKDLRWLFPPICQRKDQAALTEYEKTRYLCAFEMINADGTLGQLVDIHGQMHMQHTNARLLPWHRVFLHLFEEALHNYHPDVCVPYWDWTRVEEQHFPDWLVGVLPTVHTPTQTINVIRGPGSDSGLAAIVSGVPSAMAKTTYGDFTGPINGIHGSVHIWVGGTMSNASVSPADPVFWLHHANLDRLWWVWYGSPQGNHQNPPLTGGDAIMDPWTYTEADVRNIATLGYAYV